MESIKQLQKRDRKQKLILEGKNLYISILILALPIFLSNFMKASNDFIDYYFVSNFISDGPEVVSASMSAITVPGPVLAITQAIAAGFMVAGAAIIAQYLGAKKKENANRIAGQLLILCIITGVIMNIALFIFTPTIMGWMGASGLQRDFMIDYIRIRSFELVPLFIFFAFQASRTASGDTMTPFVLNIIMIVTNTLGTWYALKFLNMGVSGAALATVLGNLILVPICLYLMFKGNERHIRVNLMDIKFDGIELKRIFKLSWPMAFSSAFTSLGFLIQQSIILTAYNAAVNPFGTGGKINQMVLMPAMGIGGILATFVGQNIGAKNVKRARESVKAAIILSVLIAIVGCAIILPFRNQIASIFLDDSVEIKLSGEYMFFVLTGLPLMSIFQVFMGSYQGSGETKYSLYIAIIRLWCMRIPFIYFFYKILHMPSSTIWYAMTLSNFGSIYVGTMLYTRCKFLPKVDVKKRKLKEELCLS